MIIMNVSNKKCIRNLSIKNMKSAKGRNIIASIAIALTTILFTTLFTITMSIVDSLQQSNFRQVGTYAHGEFKRLTYEQYIELKDDPDIKEHGLRRVAGVAAGDAFLKHIAEVSFCSDNTANWMYLQPTQGRLPRENTNELATDSKVLSLLGAKGEIGEEITLTVAVDKVEVTERFILCGIFDYDGALPVSHILVAESMVERLVAENDKAYLDENLGSYGMDVMLKNEMSIEEDLTGILNRHGYNTENGEQIDIGINWGYLTENEDIRFDAATICAIAALLLLIIFTGYLIIFNVFRISVTNDIRYYGLLKTIGTTGKQIKRIISIQALVLSATGIPAGLAVGFGVGVILTPVVMNELNVYQCGASANPLIFVLAAMFSLETVLISCKKPAKTAAAVSPVEALRYTEASSGKGIRRKKKGASVIAMAAANLSRSKGRTAVTVISLALSVLLFNITAVFSDSFDMDKYLQRMSSDFVISDASYFNTYQLWSGETAMSEEEMELFLNLDGVESGYAAYGVDMSPEALYTEEQFRRISSLYGEKIEEEIMQAMLEGRRHESGLYFGGTQVMGLDRTGLEKLELAEGEIESLSEDGYIAVANIGNFKAGDKVKFVYTDSTTYINKATGEKSDSVDYVLASNWSDIGVERETHEKEYTVCAVIKEMNVGGYGFSRNADFFVMDSVNFIRDMGNAVPLYAAIDVSDEKEGEIESFIEDYAAKSTLDYNSRAKMAEEFESFRRMFIILGGVLSIIVGLVGILNFINTVLTGIFTRRRELAVLQSIGMTGSQLKRMLVAEGLFYTMGAAVIVLVLDVCTAPLIGPLLEDIFWFCTYKFTIAPIMAAIPMFAVMGTIIPVIVYKSMIKKSVVERLRETE